jgi:hypothetical protein
MDVALFSSKDELPLGYEVLTSTMFGQPAGLNRGLRSELYLCLSRDAPGPPITDLLLIFLDEGEKCPAGYTQISHNLNSWRPGHDVYVNREFLPVL